MAAATAGRRWSSICVALCGPGFASTSFRGTQGLGCVVSEFLNHDRFIPGRLCKRQGAQIKKCTTEREGAGDSSKSFHELPVVVRVAYLVGYFARLYSAVGSGAQ